MTLRHLSTGVALALMLAACGQKQSAPTPEAATTAGSETQGAAAASVAATPSAPPAPAGQAMTAKRFDTKTGRATFSISGVQSGTETITWDDWGARQVTESKTSLKLPGGMQGASGMPGLATAAAERSRRFVMTGDTALIIDMTGKTYMRMDGIKERAEAIAGSPDAREMSKEMLERMGAAQAGSDTVAGKTCELWKIEKLGTTACIWHGLALRTESTIMGVSMIKVATSIEENVPVDNALFEVPAGFAETSMPPMGAGLPPGAPSGSN